MPTATGGKKMKETYTLAEIARAVNAQVNDEIQMGADERQAELATSILRGFLAKLEEGAN